MSQPGVAQLVIRQGDEFTSTAYRRAANQTTIIPIPVGFEARMNFAPRYDSPSATIALTSSPAAGLTIDYANGAIAIYVGATVTELLAANVPLVWQIDIYDPLNPDAVIFLGSGTAVVKPSVP